MEQITLHIWKELTYVRAHTQPRTYYIHVPPHTLSHTQTHLQGQINVRC